MLPKIWSNSSKIQNRDTGGFFFVSFPILFPYPIVGSLLSILLQTLKPKDKAKGVESAPIVGSRRGNLPLQVEPNHKSNYHLVSVWIGIICICDLSFAFSFPFFFLFLFLARVSGDKFHCYGYCS